MGSPLVSTLGSTPTSSPTQKRKPRNFSKTSLPAKLRYVLTYTGARFFDLISFQLCTRDFTEQVSPIRITTASCYETGKKTSYEKHAARKRASASTLETLLETPIPSCRTTHRYLSIPRNDQANPPPPSPPTPCFPIIVHTYVFNDTNHIIGL